MPPELAAILGLGVAGLGVGASLAALILSGQRSLSARLDGVETAIHSLSNRVARLEGAFPFLAARVAEPAASAANAEASGSARSGCGAPAVQPPRR